MLSFNVSTTTMLKYEWPGDFISVGAYAPSALLYPVDYVDLLISCWQNRHIGFARRRRLTGTCYAAAGSHISFGQLTHMLHCI